MCGCCCMVDFCDLLHRSVVLRYIHVLYVLYVLCGLCAVCAARHIVCAVCTFLYVRCVLCMICVLCVAIAGCGDQRRAPGGSERAHVRGGGGTPWGRAGTTVPSFFLCRMMHVLVSLRTRVLLVHDRVMILDWYAVAPPRRSHKDCYISSCSSAVLAVAVNVTDIVLMLLSLPAPSRLLMLT